MPLAFLIITLRLLDMMRHPTNSPRRHSSLAFHAALSLSVYFLALPGLSWTQTAAAAMTEEEMFFKGVTDVNEGELNFLTQAPATPVHHHQNRITLSESSLVDGWVHLVQCHSHIDAVPSLQITYGEGRVRALRVTRAGGIGRAWVEGASVQMENITADASICIEAETRALEKDGQSRFILKNGPYMRGFLDGYYPMRVTMAVKIQAPQLRFLDISPAPQPGFLVSSSQGEIGFDTLFEGRLTTLVRFATETAP
jgi:hypothetical protein